MTRLAFAISLGLIPALAGVSEGKTVSIDFTGASPVSQGLMPVNNRDGALVMAQRGGKNVAMTGNSAASHYLYLAIDPAFKQGLKHVWLTVEYFDEGTDGFQVEYDAQGKKVKEFGKSTPMGRPGQPNEVAPAFLFLACEDSSYVTAQVLHPDGGDTTSS